MNWISGVELPFERAICQKSILKNPNWSSVDLSHLSDQIDKLLRKGTIEEYKSSQEEFLSPTFLIPKPDGTSLENYLSKVNSKETELSTMDLFHLSDQIDKLLRKGTIEECESSQGEFLSPTFLISKSDGTSRLILNLKGLNYFITTEHFKLEDIRTVRDLLRRDTFMVTLDLKDAYYDIPIKKSDQ